MKSMLTEGSLGQNANAVTIEDGVCVPGAYSLASFSSSMMRCSSTKNSW